MEEVGRLGRLGREGSGWQERRLRRQEAPEEGALGQVRG